MLGLLDQLNNREIAIFGWTGVLLIWMLAIPKVRKAMGGVVKAFCQRPILKVIGCAAIYIFASIWLLHWRGIWTADFLYTTILWTISFAFVAMFEAEKMSSDQRHMGRIIRDVFNVTAVLIFVIELHSFSLVVELIAVPVLTFIVLLHEVSKIKEEHGRVERFLSTVLSAVGLSYLAISLWKTWIGFDEINSVDTIRAFFIPIMLSLFFLPFLYGLGVFMAYERIFGSLSIWMDRPLLRFARSRALLTWGANLDFLQRWHRAIQRERPETKDALRQSFTKLQTILKREKSPPPVAHEQGWSPWTAKVFMSDYDLNTRDYHEGYDGEWFAESNMKALGSGSPMNGIAYSVEGEAAVAKKLKLKLNVNDSRSDAHARAHFEAAALSLWLKASGGSPDKRLQDRISAMEDFALRIGSHTISLAKDDWSRGTRPEYDLVFMVSVGS